MLSNLRVPMFAHAGDSEDEAEEDRENLVADVEDSDEEENERMVSRRRNYQLLLERAKQRKGKTEATVTHIPEFLKCKISCFRVS